MRLNKGVFLFFSMYCFLDQYDCGNGWCQLNGLNLHLAKLTQSIIIINQPIVLHPCIWKANRNWTSIVCDWWLFNGIMQKVKLAISWRFFFKTVWKNICLDKGGKRFKIQLLRSIPILSFIYVHLEFHGYPTIWYIISIKKLQISNIHVRMNIVCDIAIKVTHSTLLKSYYIMESY